MPYSLIKIALLLSVFFSLTSLFPVIAQDKKNTLFYQSKADQLNLSQSSFWKLLLKETQSNYSAVKDPSFFLISKNHKNLDLKGELNAVITALTSGDIYNQKKILCRFPLRSKWLKEQLNIVNSNLEKVNCLKLEEFLINNNIKKIWAVFIDEEENIIPNMMGHIGLRLENIKPQSDLMISFVTLINTANLTSMLYKTLVNGAEGGIQLNNFNFLKQHYLTKEKRSIWQYPIKLTHNQIQTLLLHLWEIKDIHSIYSYLSYNCGTAIIDLLSVANVEIKQMFSHLQLKRSKYWYSPKEYLSVLKENQFLDQSLETLTSRDYNLKVSIKKKLLKNASTSRLGLSILKETQSKSKKNMMQLSFRLGGSQLADNQQSSFNKYELEVMAFDLDYDLSEQNIQLNTMSLYSFKYLPSFALNFPKLSWLTSIGANQTPYSSYLGLNVDFAFGLSYSLKPLGLFSALIGFKTNSQNDEYLKHSSIYTMQYYAWIMPLNYQNISSKFISELEVNTHIENSELDFLNLKASLNFYLSDNHSLQLMFQKKKTNKAVFSEEKSGLGYSHSF